MKLNVKEFFNKQQCSKSKKFYPSFKKMIETGDESEYRKYCEWRRFKNIDDIIKNKKVLISMMEDGNHIDPIVVDGDIIVDGNHRLIIAEVLGMEFIEAIPGKLKEKNIDIINDIRGKCYQHIHRGKNYPTWKGIPMLKFPSDLLLYSEVIHETKPDFILEIGTKFGGSALYLQDMLDMNNNNAEVITVDIKDQVEKKDERISYLIGDSTSTGIFETVKQIIRGKIMIILDGDHSEEKVLTELSLYADFVSPGCFLVLEDCYVRNGIEYGPAKARSKFLKQNKNFINTNLDKRFFCGMNVGGWLRRI